MDECLNNNNENCELHKSQNVLWPWCVWGTLLLSLPRLIQYRVMAGCELIDSVAPLQFTPLAVIVIFVVLVGWSGRENCRVSELVSHQVDAGRCLPLNLTMLLCALLTMTEGVACFAGGGFPYSTRLLLAFTSDAGTAAGLLIWLRWGFCLLNSEERRKSVEIGLSLKAQLLSYCASTMVPLLFEWLPLTFLGSKGALCCRCVAAACLSLIVLRWIVVRGSLAFVSDISSAVFGLCVERTILTFYDLNIAVDSPTSLWWVLVALAGGAFAVVARCHFDKKKRASCQVDGGDINSEMTREAQLARLSKREREVVRLFLEGLTASEIALRLGISIGTVGTYKARAFSKFGLNTKDGLGSLKGALGENDETFSLCGDKRRKVASWPFALLLLATLSVAASFGQVGPAKVLVVAEIVCLILSYVFDRKNPEGAPRPLGITVLLGHLTLVLIAGVLYDYASNSFTGPVGLVLVWLMAPFPAAFVASILSSESCLAWKGQLPAMFSSLDDSEAFRALLLGVSIWEYVGQISLVIGSGWAIVLVIVIIPPVLFGLLTLERKMPKHAEDCGESAMKKRAINYLMGRGLAGTEAEVAYYTAIGLSRAQISIKIHVAQGTVNSYRASSYRQLSVHSSWELRKLLNDYAGQSLSV